MKTTTTLAALLLGFAATLITLSPMTSWAAADAEYSQRQPIPALAAAECPVTRPAGPADCSTAPGPLETASYVTRLTMDDLLADSGQNDASRKLLEDLVAKGPEL
jgi:hypothetical protein